MEHKEYGFHLKVLNLAINLEDQVIAYFGISFEDRSEQQLCKILLS